MRSTFIKSTVEFKTSNRKDRQPYTPSSKKYDGRSTFHTSNKKAMMQKEELVARPYRRTTDFADGSKLVVERSKGDNGQDEVISYYEDPLGTRVDTSTQKIGGNGTDI